MLKRVVSVVRIVKSTVVKDCDTLKVFRTSRGDDDVSEPQEVSLLVVTTKCLSSL